MTRFNKRIFAVAGCWLAFAPTGFAQETDDPVLDCRSLPSAEERLKCYDDAVDDRSTPSEEPAAAEEAPAAENTSPPAPAASSTAAAAAAVASAEADFGLPPGANSQPVADQIEASITELSRTASGKFAIELDNGQLWRQTDNSSMRVKEGEVVIIKRGSLGSFKLTKDGTKRSMKVKRVR